MTLFQNKGVHCVVDGQFGSTGKGALSAWLAWQAYKNLAPHAFNFAGAIYSGGPNSGHTSYFGDEKIVLKQLPTFAVSLHKLGLSIPVYLSAGAVIDRDILKEEAERYPYIPIFVHHNAAIVTDEDKREEEQGSIGAVAGTRSGTGAALVRKIRREPNAIADRSLGRVAKNVMLMDHAIEPEHHAYFMEVAQGFSLGINSRFYPKVTSRECTVMQGLADARIPPRHLARTYMAIRSYPIRVGDVDGHSSGTWYFDQQETTWEALKREPEITTVTKRVRRVATFSMTQFLEACVANDPDYVFASHMDYFTPEEHIQFIDGLHEASAVLSKKFDLLVGFGPKIEDIERSNWWSHD
jgi:adenylosuccinate synthase